MRVLVCGGRGFTDQALLEGWMDDLHRVCGFTGLIHGGARGADAMGGAWALRNSIPVQVFPADWENLGKAAGHARNTLMLTQGRPDFCVAFPHPSWDASRGTRDMVGKAMDANVTTIVVL